MYNIKENNQITPLEFEERYKDLGVTFDKLTFWDHIHEKVHKAYAMLGIIKRNFKYISINNFILLYKSMVRLVYCLSMGTLQKGRHWGTRKSSEEGNQDYPWNKIFAIQGSS